MFAYEQFGLETCQKSDDLNQSIS